MNIRIHQQYARIGIVPHHARLSIEQPPARMRISRERGGLSIESEPALIFIDQTQCFAESGRKPILMLCRDIAEESKQRVLEAIGQIAEDGNRFLEIQTGANAVSELAEARMGEQAETNIVFMPTSRPIIDIRAGKFNINFRPDILSIDWEVHTRANIEATRARVEYYMKEWPGIEIEYIGDRLDEYV